jgi:hypothetical protein
MLVAEFALFCSPGGTAESSPRREPWETRIKKRPKPCKGERLAGGLSFAPPGLARDRASYSQGLRPGLNSFALSGLADPKP